MEEMITKVPKLDHIKPNKPYLYSMFFFKCPRCREQSLFKTANPYNLPKMFDMHRECPKCGQPFEMEIGFYWGAMYVGYTLSSGTLLFLFFLLWLGFKVNGDMAIFIDVTSVVLLMPFIFRLSRSMWLHFFYKGEKK
jgi:endogenous inhibitor of DNA gyrase (YacG/DUF329 family)